MVLNFFHKTKCMPHSEELHQGKLDAHTHHSRDTMWNSHFLYYQPSLCSSGPLSHKQHSDPLSWFPSAPRHQPTGMYTPLH